MDSEHETLDWGNDEDEQLNPYPGSTVPEADDTTTKTDETDDVEDIISLDGNDEDMQDLCRQNAQAAEVSTPKPKTRSLAQMSAEPSYSDLTAQFSDASLTKAGSVEKNSVTKSSNRERTVSVTHPLPAKPQVAAPIPRHQDHMYSATAMRPSSDSNRLPLGWVTKQSKNGNGMYYYNTKTHETTWDRPVEERKDAFRSKEAPRPSTRQDAMTYNDRHYRPESASQGQDSYRKDSRQTHPSKQMPTASEDSPAVYNREVSTSTSSEEYRNGQNDTKYSPRHEASARTTSAFSSTLDNQSRNERGGVPERDQAGPYNWAPRQPPALQEVTQTQYSSDPHPPYRYSPPGARTSYRNNEARQASPDRRRSPQRNLDPPPHLPAKPDLVPRPSDDAKGRPLSGSTNHMVPPLLDDDEALVPDEFLQDTKDSKPDSSRISQSLLQPPRPPSPSLRVPTYNNPDLSPRQPGSFQRRSPLPPQEAIFKASPIHSDKGDIHAHDHRSGNSSAEYDRPGSRGQGGQSKLTDTNGSFIEPVRSARRLPSDTILDSGLREWRYSASEQSRGRNDKYPLGMYVDREQDTSASMSQAAPQGPKVMGLPSLGSSFGPPLMHPPPSRVSGPFNSNGTTHGDRRDSHWPSTDRDANTRYEANYPPESSERGWNRGRTHGRGNHNVSSHHSQETISPYASAPPPAPPAHPPYPPSNRGPTNYRGASLQRTSSSHDLSADDRRYVPSNRNDIDPPADQSHWGYDQASGERLALARRNSFNTHPSSNSISATSQAPPRSSLSRSESYRTSSHQTIPRSSSFESTSPNPSITVVSEWHDRNEIYWRRENPDHGFANNTRPSDNYIRQQNFDAKQKSFAQDFGGSGGDRKRGAGRDWNQNIDDGSAHRDRAEGFRNDRGYSYPDEYEKAVPPSLNTSRHGGPGGSYYPVSESYEARQWTAGPQRQSRGGPLPSYSHDQGLLAHDHHIPHRSEEFLMPTDNFYPNTHPPRNRLSRFDRSDDRHGANHSSTQGGSYPRVVSNEFGNNGAGVGSGGGGGGRRQGASLLDRIDDPPLVPSIVPAKRNHPEGMDVDHGSTVSMEGVEPVDLDSVEGRGGEGRRFARRAPKVRRRGGR